MPNIRLTRALVLTLVAGLTLGLTAIAQTPAPSSSPAPPAAPPTEAEALLDAAIAKVKALKSVSAQIKEHVKMLGQEFDLQGRYLKSAENRVYLMLNVVGLGDSAGSSLQVCDGTTLYEVQK